MANTFGKLSKSLDWVSTGTSDTLTFNILPPLGTKGIQISSFNIDLESLTVTVYSRAGASKIASFPSATGRFGTLADSTFDISKVVISNVPAGTNKFSVTAN